MTLPTEPICVVIGRTRHKMVQIEIQEAAKQGAALIEVRLDFLAKAPDFRRLLEKKPCQMLATVRRLVDGGSWKGTEDARMALLRQAIVAGFDWVDLETDVADGVRRFRDVKRIVSYHDLREMPENLEDIHARMCRQDADIVKIAVRAQHPNDNLRVLKLLRSPAKPTVAFCVGDMGMPSRILGAKLGTPFTYAAFNKERGIAPGLPSYQELKQVYHYPRINADTLVYGVLGDPVGHSLSPLIHNEAFASLGLNAVYLPFRVPRVELPSVLKAFEALGVRGYSVTIPHKEAAANLAKHQDAAVTRVQAANTLILGKEGFNAYNTDYQGFLDSLRANMSSSHVGPTALTGVTGIINLPTPYQPPVVRLDSRVALVLGAGGIARAVVHALVGEGALVTIANRTAERAQKLAEEAGCRHIDWAGRHSVLADLVVNCTSVGMHPDLDHSPLHVSYFKPGLLVYDTVYTPEQTLLIKEARQRGCQVVTGVDLFVRQAALQFQLFTGHPAPLDLMRQVVKRALSPVAIRSTPTSNKTETGG
jgi:3-dehydroquinate dehydratase / shikimate dehydrogenase